MASSNALRRSSRQITRVRLAVGVTLALMASLVGIGLSAQQVGDNINVLPVFQGIDQFDFLRGDLYGQRQQEPSIVVSSLNKDHIAVFYNDFRAVDVPTIRRCRDFRAARSPGGSGGDAQPVCEAVRRERTHARQGCTRRSARGGNRDVGLVRRRADLDRRVHAGPAVRPVAASVKSPGFGLEGMSDPVAISAPCGRFYVAYLSSAG